MNNFLAANTPYLYGLALFLVLSGLMALGRLGGWLRVHNLRRRMDLNRVRYSLKRPQVSRSGHRLEPTPAWLRDAVKEH